MYFVAVLGAMFRKYSFDFSLNDRKYGKEIHKK